MVHHSRFAKWATIASAAFFSASAFASGGGPSLSSEYIAIGAFLGAFVGVMGAAFNAKASRLFFIAFLVSVLPFVFLLVPMYSGPAGVLAAAIFAAPFMGGLSLAYGFIRLALHLFSSPPRQ